MGYGITSLDQIIDKVTLHSKLEQVRDYVEDFGSAANKVEDAGEICTPEAFSVGGNSLQEPLFQLAEEMQQQKQDFINYIDGLEEAANYLYDVQYNEYKEYQREQERIRREHERAKEIERLQAQQTSKHGI